ncbi:phage tail protein [Mucilaginibacter ginkgonis]|uniref:Tail fiber protein n=1 Tax=Mucilaginibacter ginkgonis TaxID=2682091 RepID=A0A6I4HYQ7_9SPHI|nr:tail fiber protein [Mucilaginibacter ginkgonis]QQL48567.1 tail fiber protein [Mucilaginibacter ginkgonis]
MDPIIGTIILFAGNFEPQGWAFCNGEILEISQNQALFTILGTTYGGDGMKTFALPNLVAPQSNGETVPAHYIIAVQGIYPSRG